MTIWLSDSDIRYLPLPHVGGVPVIRKAESTVIGDAKTFACRGCREAWAVEKAVEDELNRRTAALEDAIVICPSCEKGHLIGRLTPDGRLLLSEVIQ